MPHATAPPEDVHRHETLLLGIRALSRTVVSSADEQLASLDVRISDYLAISLLRIKPMSSADLARALGLTAPTITGAINALVARGLIVRTTHPRHGRIKILQVTDAGHELFVEADEVIKGLSSRVRGLLGLARADIFEECMWTLVTGLGGPAPSTDPLWPFVAPNAADNEHG